MRWPARKRAPGSPYSAMGEQAATHVRAIAHGAPASIRYAYGAALRASAAALAERMRRRTGDRHRRDRAMRGRRWREADIVCTVSGSAEPILHGAWVRPGTHLNLVGSSHARAGRGGQRPGRAHRASSPTAARACLAQGAEFLNAKHAGLIGDEHIVVAEIGEVLAGRVAGATQPEEITVYKSLGHIAQDLASAWALYRSTG